MTEIKVKVVEFGDRKHYQMQYVDPVTRKKRTRSTGVVKTGLKKDRTEAERVAAKWEAELREGRYCDPSKTTWAQFRERYEDEVLSGLADKTFQKVNSVFNLVEAILMPRLLRDVTAERLSTFQAKMRERSLAESTIAGNLAHLRAALRWAVTIGLLPVSPKVERPKRSKSGKMMKGRPITTEEFERMLGKVSTVVGDKSASAWRYYLRGLWLSGLRLTESLELYWDRDDKLCVTDIDSKFPMLRIPAELEKGNKDRLLPMAPEFAEFLRQTPVSDRIGPVFAPIPKYRSSRPSAWWVSRVVSKIGRAAKVKVSTDCRTSKVKYASAHDLRRSFGERWSAKVMPQVLMLLMRHESIDTTMKFYVGRNAKTAAQVLWDAYSLQGEIGNTLGNSDETQSAGKKPADS